MNQQSTINSSTQIIKLNIYDTFFVDIIQYNTMFFLKQLMLFVFSLTSSISVNIWLCINAIISAINNIKNPKLRVTDVKIDIDKYLGKWYQLYYIPNNFQNPNAQNVTAEYKMCNDKSIEVINKEQTNDPTEFTKYKTKTILGRAVIVDNAKLLVSFFYNFIGGIYAPYWIVEIGPIINNTYSYTVVSDPTRSFLWILARKNLDETTIADIKNRLVQTHKFKNIDKLVKTQQNFSKNEISDYDDIFESIKNIYEESSLLRFNNDKFDIVDRNVVFEDLFSIIVDKKTYETNFNLMKYVFTNIYFDCSRDNIFINDDKFVMCPDVHYKTIFGSTIITRNFNRFRLKRENNSDKKLLISYHDEGWYVVSGPYEYARSIIRFLFKFLLF